MSQPLNPPSPPQIAIGLFGLAVVFAHDVGRHQHLI